MPKEASKIKNTKLGSWLKEKAPNVLGLVGDLLPDSGALGIVKNLLDKEPGVDPAAAQAAVQAEIEYQNNVSRRWEADMASDVKLAKLIRPSVLIVLMVFFMGVMIWDGLDETFMPRESYISLLEILMLTVFGAYFAGRTIEKTRK
jgi:hypothetical protein|tara:strand:- start:318 stop:755 length:438 start_codon:yes stop_codon:yes gene_type:complete